MVQRYIGRILTGLVPLQFRVPFSFKQIFVQTEQGSVALSQNLKSAFLSTIVQARKPLRREKWMEQEKLILPTLNPINYSGTFKSVSGINFSDTTEQRFYHCR